MIYHHCRHMAYPKPGPGPFPAKCKQGIAFADVETSSSGPIWDRRGCYGKCDRPDCFAPWTPEEISENDSAINSLILALADGKCSECGKTLDRQGAAFRCPDGHVSGFACGRDDIREGAP